MKNALYVMFIIVSTINFASPNVNPTLTETIEVSNKNLNIENQNGEREKRKAKRKERKSLRQEHCQATDSLHIRFNARSGIAVKSHPSNILENGTIFLEIEEINLFRYKISITENQNDVITNTSLSSGTSLVNIDPLIFNINVEKLDIHALPVSWSDKLTHFRALERNLAKIDSEIQKSNQVLLELNDSYRNAKKIIDDKKALEKELAAISLKISRSEGDIKAQLQSDGIDLQTQIDGFVKVELDSNQKIITDYPQTKKILTDKIDKFLVTSDSLKFSIDSLKIESHNNSIKFQAFNDATKNYKKALTDLNQLTEFYRRLVSILYSDQSFAEINSEKNSATMNTFKVDKTMSKDKILEAMFQKLNQIDLSFEQLSDAYSDVSGIPIPTAGSKDTPAIIAQRSLDDKTIGQAKDTYDNISDFHNQLNPSSYHAFFLQIVKVYDAINETNFNLRFQTNIVSDNSDVIRYSVNAEPHTNIPWSIETKGISFNYDVNVVGGYKIDVSTGMFWNIGLVDYSYRFESVSPDTTRVVKEKNENLYIPSVGLLFHLYKRSNRNTKFAWNVGFSTNTQNLNYYTGFSFLLGKSERININLGLAGGQVKRVSDLYSDTEKLIPLALSDLPNEVPMKNPNSFRLGGYFGISFNLLGTKNKEAINQITITQ